MSVHRAAHVGITVNRHLKGSLRFSLLESSIVVGILFLLHSVSSPKVERAVKELFTD